jgi:hypothetical protein
MSSRDNPHETKYTFDDYNHGMCCVSRDLDFSEDVKTNLNLNQNKSHIMSDTHAHTSSSNMDTTSGDVTMSSPGDGDGDMDFDADVLKLVKSFRKTHFGTDTCLICKVKSNNIISNRCHRGCRYVCHERCLDSWIKYKKYDSFCMECNTKFPSDVVDNVLKHNYFSQGFVPLSLPYIYPNRFG